MHWELPFVITPCALQKLPNLTHCPTAEPLYTVLWVSVYAVSPSLGKSTFSVCLTQEMHQHPPGPLLYTWPLYVKNTKSWPVREYIAVTSHLISNLRGKIWSSRTKKKKKTCMQNMFGHFLFPVGHCGSLDHFISRAKTTNISIQTLLL